MSNLDRSPVETECSAGDTAPGRVEILTPREVPLGGPRAMLVRRTLPQRERSLIGAWCFVDHYGPDHVRDSGGMTVAPHPHIGLQTVSWLFTGEVMHRDSVGTAAMVRPGEVNLMTSGRGISHSEVSPDDTTILHGVQLWVALPDEARHGAPAFEHYAPPLLVGAGEHAGLRARVFLGSVLGQTSPVATFTPLLGAELVLDPGARVSFVVDPAFEHGVLVDTGSVTVGAHAPAHAPDHMAAAPTPGTATAHAELAYLAPGASVVELTADPDEETRLVLLGGPPFGESIVMWWNFVGRSHEEIVAARDAWQGQITAGGGEVVNDSQLVDAGPFGVVIDDHLPPIPAPALPNARLRERR